MKMQDFRISNISRIARASRVMLVMIGLLGMSMMGCKSKTDSALDDMDNFVTKWEKKVASKTITVDDKKEFKEEVTVLNAKYQRLQAEAAKFTPEQQEKVMKLGQRMTMLMMNGSLIDISIP